MNRPRTTFVHQVSFCFSLALMCLFAPHFAGAQSAEIGLLLGGSHYQGDLTPSEIKDYPKFIHPAAGAFLRLNRGRLSGRLGFSYGKISGDDEFSSPSRDLNFESNILEGSAIVELNLIMREKRSGFAVYPYIFGGIGLYHFDPEGTQLVDGAETTARLQPLGTEGQGTFGFEAPYALTQISIPFGGGIKMHFGNRWIIGIEMGPRKVFTDYLDDLSAVEISYNDVLNRNGSLAAAFSRPGFKPNTENADEPSARGRPSPDWYYIGGVTVSYLFGDGHPLRGLDPAAHCPTF